MKLVSPDPQVASMLDAKFEACRRKHWKLLKLPEPKPTPAELYNLSLAQMPTPLPNLLQAAAMDSQMNRPLGALNALGAGWLL